MSASLTRLSWSPARRRSSSNGCVSRTVTRCCSNRCICQQSAFPGCSSADLEHELALSVAQRALRHAHRAVTRDVRAGRCCAPARPHCSVLKPRTPALLVEGISFSDEHVPVEFSRTRTCAAIGLAITSNEPFASTEMSAGRDRTGGHRQRTRASVQLHQPRTEEASDRATDGSATTFRNDVASCWRACAGTPAPTPGPATAGHDCCRPGAIPATRHRPARR